MVSITLSVPEEIRALMKKHPEMNWSGFVRQSIQDKVKKLEKLRKIEEQLDKEQKITDWSVKLQRTSRSGRLEELKRKGLI